MADVVENLLPTPGTKDHSFDAPGRTGGASLSMAFVSEPEDARARGHHVTINEVAQSLPSWGPYEPAIRRWEAVLGRVAPWATEPSPRSKKGRLSPRFVEWLMGWAEGWVTAIPGLGRNAMLKILGNGVVPQQAEAAVRFLLAPPPRWEYRRPKRKVTKRATARALMAAAKLGGD